MINLEMCFKTITIVLNSYLGLSDDWMLYVVLQHEMKEKKKKKKEAFSCLRKRKI